MEERQKYNFWFQNREFAGTDLGYQLPGHPNSASIEKSALTVGHGAFVVLLIVALNWAVLEFVRSQESPGVGSGFLLVFGAQLSILFSLLIFHLLSGDPLTKIFAIEPDVKTNVFLCLALGCLGFLFSVLLILVLHFDTFLEQYSERTQLLGPTLPVDDASTALAFRAFAEAGLYNTILVAILIMAPVLEELLFRGALFGIFLRKWGPWAAVIGSAVLFGLAHYHMNPIQAVTTFQVGLLCGGVRLYSGSVRPAILVHLVNNVAAVGLSALNNF